MKIEGARMIALNRSEEWIRLNGLTRLVPRRRGRTGVRPGPTGKDPKSRHVGNQDQWEFPDIVLTKEEKRRILAAVVRVAIEVLFSTHLYTFGGKVFQQEEGGPIGLRATCGVARVIMNMWDKEWLRTLESWKVKFMEYFRYMDDGRVLLHAIKSGWRWEDKELVWKEEWAKEDDHLSAQMITKRVMDGSMQEVFSFLKLTTEVGEDYPDDWLPTLDVSLKVEQEDGEVLWRFYEKPTTAPTTVQGRSAMGVVSKTQILANDLVRRLLNTCPKLPVSEVEKVVDDYAKKLVRSGHVRKKVEEIILAGIRGYERKVRRCAAEGRNLYRTSSESFKPRQLKKVLGAKTWFRKRKGRDQEVAEDEKRCPKRRRLEWDRKTDKTDLPVRSVLFVDYSTDSLLLGKVKETLQRLESVMGCKVKAVERTGVPLGCQFPLTRLWEGAKCGRDGCITYNQ